jgi:lipoic acid synthetase
MSENLPQSASTPGNAPGLKHKGEAKTSRIPIKVVAAERLKKPDWIRVRAPSSPRFYEIKKILREHNLHTVCEEASCPNIGECFGKGTATFMIMGDICTRRCPFCDVGHGRPLPLDADEPPNLAQTIAALELLYVVITRRRPRRSARRRRAAFRRLHSRGACAVAGYADRSLVPDFRGRLGARWKMLSLAPPDVMNHNLETVPRLYRQAWPGSITRIR